MISGIKNGLDASTYSPAPHTPGQSSPAKPPLSEMHPSKVHPTTATDMNLGLHLGFTDIKHAEKGLRSHQPGVPRSSPSKPPANSSPFTFRFTRPNGADLGLSGEAQRMMEELREEAMKIKADLTAQREQERETEEAASGRRFAQPKGKASRFSAAHMAEFKKMDSIANHPSAFRGLAGKSTPATKGIKRSQSKANLEDGDPSPSKQTVPLSLLKKTSTTFRDEQKAAFKKSNLLFETEPMSAVKRARQHIDDDASSSRPGSQDGSYLPRPTTAGKGHASVARSQTLASLMTPTKASLARVAGTKRAVGQFIPPSTSRPQMMGLKKSVSTNNIRAAAANENPSHVISPGRLDRVKSILRGQKSADSVARSALPLPSAKTPAAARVDKPLPRIPSTTPRRKLQKRVAFTPETKQAALLQNSPSVFKSGVPRSSTREILGEVHYPSLEAIMSTGLPDGTVKYPDLTEQRALPQPPTSTKKIAPTEPGTFTFRSDHTIRFESTSPTGFGSSPGQASLRHVRPSVMPGSFPTSVAIYGPDKENKEPVTFITGAAHGLSNKKRHRSGDEDDDADGYLQPRAVKKQRREPVPEGDALMAPRLVSSKRLPRPGFSSPKKPSQLASFRSPASASPGKKRAILSMSRLNMLARPKARK
jgi:hypothetical protein